jgi:putative ABC transport system permease protein
VLTSLRQVCRSLRRSPASAIAAIVTLALTLASATAIFAIVDATLLTPPPFAHPESLVAIGEVPSTAPASAIRAVSPRTLRAWRAQADGALQLEFYDPTNVTLTGGQYPERLSGMAVSPGFFALLGIAPRIGRTFSARDAAEAAFVLVSDEFWRTKLFADPNPLGKTLIVSGKPRAIVGVLPETFEFALSASPLWLPLDVGPGDDGDRFRVLGRLAPGVTPATPAALLRSAAPDQSRGLQPSVLPLTRLLQGRALQTMPLLLLAAGLGLTLAAVNLAGLMMLRTMDRSRELAVRAALGATRGELLEPLLLEAHVLVGLGTAAGILLALWMTPVAAQLASTQLGTTAVDIAIGWRSAAAILAVGLGCAWLSTLVPAFAATRRLNLAQIERAQVSASPPTLTVRRLFVAAEVAVAFVLLAGLLLVGRSLRAVTAIEPGFVHEAVLTARVAVPPAPYASDPSVAAFYQQLEDALSARLGRNAFAIVDELPLTGDAGRIRVAVTKGDPLHEAVARVAGAQYFGTLRIPVFDGRPIDDRDRLDATPVVVISRSLATALYPDSRAVGRRLWIPRFGQTVDIAGVVGDVKHRALEEDTIPTLYFAAAQQPSRSSHIVLRTGRPDSDTLDIVRAEVARLDPALPVYAPRTMDEVVRTSAGVPVRRVVSATFAAFALLALVIAAVGVFGVVAHDVGARRLEMALRLALGAHPRRLHRAVLRQAAAILAIGLAAGLLLSLLLARLVHALLYGVRATDVATMAAVTALLSGTMLLAAILPARRAARTNPVDVLRLC